MSDLHSPSSCRWGDLLFLILVGVFLFFPFLGRRDLWTSGEARVAQVARQMRTTGDWIVPQLGGDVRLKKPPLAYWLVVLASYIAPSEEIVDEWNARIPSATAAIGTMLLVYLLGLSLFGRREGLLGAIAFGTTGVIWWQARTVGIESPHLFFNTLALYGWWRYHKSEKKGMGWLWLCYVALGFSVLVKGIGPFLILTIILAYLFILPEFRQGERKGVGPLVPHLVGLGILLLLVLPWALAVASQEPEVWKLWQRESLGRYRGFDHVKHPFYFFGKIFGDGLPWIFPALLAFSGLDRRSLERILIGFAGGIAVLAVLGVRYLLWRRGLVSSTPIVYPFAFVMGIATGWLVRGWLQRRAFQSTEGGGQMSVDSPPSPLLFPMVWILATLFFFSLPASKKSYYVLPIYPAIAILAGWVAARIQDGTLSSFASAILDRVIQILSFLFLVLALIGYPLALFLVERVEKFRMYAGHERYAILLSLLAGIAGGIFCLARRLRCPSLVLATLLGGTLLVFAAHISQTLIFNRHKAIRHLCEIVKPYLTSDDVVVTYGPSGLPIVTYYLDRPVLRQWDVEHLFETIRTTEKGRVYLLTQPEEIEELEWSFVVKGPRDDLPRIVEADGFRIPYRDAHVALLVLPEGKRGEGTALDSEKHLRTLLGASVEVSSLLRHLEAIGEPDPITQKVWMRTLPSPFNTRSPLNGESAH